MKLSDVFVPSKILAGSWEYIISDKYHIVICAGHPWKSVPQDKSLSIDAYEAFEAIFFNLQQTSTGKVHSTFSRDDYARVKILPYNEIDPLTFCPADIIIQAVEILQNLAGVHDLASTPLPQKADEKKSVCPKCNGKKILDFGLYTRPCMDCYEE